MVEGDECVIVEEEKAAICDLFIKLTKLPNNCIKINTYKNYENYICRDNNVVFDISSLNEEIIVTNIIIKLEADIKLAAINDIILKIKEYIKYITS
jgi:hypothetical protein